MKTIRCLAAGQCLCLVLCAADTFVPYETGQVPQNVAELWGSYDARKEDLDVKIIREWKADGGATRYAITSANDAPPRDPKDWKLLGSNDGENWTTLDSRAGELWSKRNERRCFSVNDGAAYKSYRLNIAAVRNRAAANSVQIAEIEFLQAQTH